jgi:hypothetical protein
MFAWERFHSLQSTLQVHASSRIKIQCLAGRPMEGLLFEIPFLIVISASIKKPYKSGYQDL